MLALPAPQFAHICWKDDGLLLPCSGKKVVAAPEGSNGRGTAFDVWDGAAVLALYLDQFKEELECKNGLKESNAACVELGAGTAIAGVSARALFYCPTVLTDHPDVEEQMIDTVQRNIRGADKIAVIPHDWYEGGIVLLQRLRAAHLPGHTGPIEPRLLLASDCVWLDWLVQPFVDVLASLVCAFPQATCLLAHKTRAHRVDEQLHAALASYSLQMQLRPQPNGACSCDTRVYELVSQQKSA